MTAYKWILQVVLLPCPATEDWSAYFKAYFFEADGASATQPEGRYSESNPSLYYKNSQL
jgi:hypothetical protein